MAAAVIGLVGLMAFLTLYLPALQARRQGNLVHAHGLTFRLSAQPNFAYRHGVELELAISPPLDALATVEMRPSMPSMGSMRAQVSGLHQLAPGRYQAAADLGMGGLWEVQVLVHRPGQPDTVARFRLNA